MADVLELFKARKVDGDGKEEKRREGKRREGKGKEGKGRERERKRREEKGVKYREEKALG